MWIRLIDNILLGFSLLGNMINHNVYKSMNISIKRALTEVKRAFWGISSAIYRE